MPEQDSSSRRGQQTTDAEFRPMRFADPAGTGRPQSQTGSPGTEGARPVVLVVEDDPDLRENMKSLLEDEGFRVVLAADLAQSRACLENETVTAVIADYMIPDGDGMQVLREARSRNPHVRGILMTGFGESYIRSGVVRQEGFEFVRKPFEVEEILHLVAQRTR